MTTAIYPGRFDPVTAGHLDILQRASLSLREGHHGRVRGAAEADDVLPRKSGWG